MILVFGDKLTERHTEAGCGRSVRRHFEKTKRQSCPTGGFAAFVCQIGQKTAGAFFVWREKGVKGEGLCYRGEKRVLRR